MTSVLTAAGVALATPAPVTLPVASSLWSAALTAEEIASLASGTHPTRVRPGSLVRCYEPIVFQPPQGARPPDGA